MPTQRYTIFIFPLESSFRNKICTFFILFNFIAHLESFIDANFVQYNPFLIANVI